MSRYLFPVVEWKAIFHNWVPFSLFFTPSPSHFGLILAIFFIGAIRIKVAHKLFFLRSRLTRAVFGTESGSLTNMVSLLNFLGFNNENHKIVLTTLNAAGQGTGTRNWRHFYWHTKGRRFRGFLSFVIPRASWNTRYIFDPFADHRENKAH